MQRIESPALLLAALASSRSTCTALWLTCGFSAGKACLLRETEPGSECSRGLHARPYPPQGRGVKSTRLITELVRSQNKERAEHWTVLDWRHKGNETLLFSFYILACIPPIPHGHFDLKR